VGKIETNASAHAESDDNNDDNDSSDDSNSEEGPREESKKMGSAQMKLTDKAVTKKAKNDTITATADAPRCKRNPTFIPMRRLPSLVNWLCRFMKSARYFAHPVSILRPIDSSWVKLTARRKQIR
jgi:hypothetical protein